MNITLLDPPIFELPFTWLASIGNLRLGIRQRDEWCTDIRGKTTILSNPADMMPLLPLLEIGKTAFYEHLSHVEQTYADLSNASQSFPAVFLLRFAFESSVSDYWPLKAIDWLDADGTIEPTLRESLRDMLSKPWLTQHLKHRVERVTKRTRRG